MVVLDPFTVTKFWKSALYIKIQRFDRNLLKLHYRVHTDVLNVNGFRDCSNIIKKYVTINYKYYSPSFLLDLVV